MLSHTYGMPIQHVNIFPRISTYLTACLHTGLHYLIPTGYYLSSDSIPNNVRELADVDSSGWQKSRRHDTPQNPEGVVGLQNQTRWHYAGHLKQREQFI